MFEFDGCRKGKMISYFQRIALHHLSSAAAIDLINHLKRKFALIHLLFKALKCDLCTVLKMGSFRIEKMKLVSNKNQSKKDFQTV